MPPNPKQVARRAAAQRNHDGSAAVTHAEIAQFVACARRAAQDKSLEDALEREPAWRSQPWWVLVDSAFDRMRGVCDGVATGTMWTYLNSPCPHVGSCEAKQRCNCPKMLNEAHPDWGLCRVVDGEARPVFKGSDVRTAEKECEPFGVVVLCLRSVGWAEAHAREALGMLRHWQPADVERSGLICAVVEGLAQSAHGAIRDAATALLYEPGAVAVPRVRLATRLEHAMTPAAEELQRNTRERCFKALVISVATSKECTVTPGK